MPYVALNASMLETLSAAAAELRLAQRELRRSTEKLGELGEDLCSDAVSRLEERHAAAPQIESYRDGLAYRRHAVARGLEGLADATRSLERALAEVRGFNGVGSELPS